MNNIMLQASPKGKRKRMEHFTYKDHTNPHDFARVIYIAKRPCQGFISLPDASLLICHLVDCSFTRIMFLLMYRLGVT
jgi:hypothetical protein